jgi:hypothetical protein
VSCHIEDGIIGEDGGKGAQKKKPNKLAETFIGKSGGI